MRRADGLFDIIQMLRVAAQPITAAAIAERAEVVSRSGCEFCSDITEQSCGT